jgi:hypothetical protein
MARLTGVLRAFLPVERAMLDLAQGMRAGRSAPAIGTLGEGVALLDVTGVEAPRVPLLTLL